MSFEDDEYPELTKMGKVQEQSQIIGEFIEESGWVLAEWSNIETEYGGYEKLMPVSLSIEQILARYFNIDLQAVERERRAILDSIRDQ